MDNEPWALLGEAIVAVVPKRKAIGLKPLPRGIHEFPGPVLVAVERYVDSPVGPYTVLSIAEPARSGMKIGFHVSTAVVNNGDARRVMRQRWGLPAELGSVSWSTAGVKSIAVWDDHDLKLEVESTKRPFTSTLPVNLYQQRSDSHVKVPLRMKALVRRARVTISSPEDGMYAFLAGKRRGFKLSNMNVRVLPAKKRRGYFVLRAPGRMPEPGVLGMDNKIESL